MQPLEKVLFFIKLTFFLRNQKYQLCASFLDFQKTFKERNFFDSWQRIAANRQDFSVGYYDDYVGTLQIFQLDKEDRRKHGVELVECYPSVVGELQADYGNLNSIYLLPVTWSYRYWKNLTDEADLPKGLLERIGEVFVNTVERNIRSRIPAVLRKL